jgi:hypothetical protein
MTEVQRLCLFGVVVVPSWQSLQHGCTVPGAETHPAPPLSSSHLTARDLSALLESGRGREDLFNRAADKKKAETCHVFNMCCGKGRPIAPSSGS